MFILYRYIPWWNRNKTGNGRLLKYELPNKDANPATVKFYWMLHHYVVNGRFVPSLKSFLDANFVNKQKQKA